LSSQGIHQAVETIRRRREHQYLIDVPRLKQLRPDLVVTQELCNVCAASHPEVSEAVHQLPDVPKIVSVSARQFEELFQSIDALGHATRRIHQATVLSGRLRREVDAIQRRVSRVSTKPRVWCAEWLEPLMAAGHWVPEMVAMAGGLDGLGRIGANSVPMPWEDIRRYDPEVILVMPCSFSIARTVNEFRLLTDRPGWDQLSAVQSGRVFAVQTSLFHRPGPRLVQGLKLMAALCHPERFPKPPAIQAKKLA